MQIENYVPIQSLDVEAERAITFDLYLNLPLNNKVLRYRKKGGTLESDRLARLAEGNLTNFWIRKEDYKEFVKYVAARLQALVEHPDPVTQKNMAIVSAKAILSSTFKSTDPAMLKALVGNLNEITSMLIESVLQNISPVRKRAFKRLMEFSEKGTDFHKHPVNVTSLSVLISFGIGYSTHKILTEVAMGALLHDIGLARLPVRVSTYAHDPLALTPNERQLLYDHGQRGLEILDEKGITMSEIVKSIIIQHHEQFNGFGYPVGLRGFDINEFAQIVRVADELDHLLQAHSENAENLRKYLESMFLQLHEEKIIDPALATRIRNLFL
ncbi:MAG: HD-GYP domain-containing protein [Bdellovibrio sp.]